jgi:diamine N-acetyltransferase
MLIRPATLQDAAALRDLTERTFRDTYAAFNTPENMERHVRQKFGLDQIQAELSDGQLSHWVVEEEKHLIGFAKLVKDHHATGLESHKAIEVERFYIDRKFHGRGLGAYLMDACVEYAQQQSFTAIWLGVWEHNPNAIAFYEKQGFVRFGAHTFVLGEDVQTDFLVWKRL